MNQRKKNLFILLTSIFLLLAFFVYKNYSQSQSAIAQEVKDTRRTEKDIPNEVYIVLDYVRTHHQAMKGYVGGREFKNREKKLPIFDSNHIKIEYQEWDIYPKINRVNRGTHRLITGNDYSAYYTNDHYNTFKKIEK